MATANQIAANRRNAQFSTGPVTAEGKAASSRNSFKSGLDAASQIVPGESPEGFAALQAEYQEHYAPANPEERFLVDTILRNEWLLRRFHRVEAQLWKYQTAEGIDMGEAFAKAEKTFLRLERRVRAAEKAAREARIELRRLQSARQPKETTAPASKSGSFRTEPVPDPDSPTFLEAREGFHGATTEQSAGASLTAES